MSWPITFSHPGFGFCVVGTTIGNKYHIVDLETGKTLDNRKPFRTIKNPTGCRYSVCVPCVQKFAKLGNHLLFGGMPWIPYPELTPDPTPPH